ncbi:MAG: hypothetical protein IJT41_04555, partial [Clostridia bacterium]|nr:hypothetical protein [Clostridia bacterium]
MLFAIIKIILTVAAVTVCAALLLFIYALISGHFIPKRLRNVPKNTSPLFADGKAQIGAHRAGAGIAPENTPLAFDICLNSESFEVRELEFDLHLTKDDKLIILHDPTLDRTTDAREKYGRDHILPSDLTYDELKALNPGEHFVTDSGETPYKGLRGDNIPEGLRIPLLDEIIDKIEAHGEYLYSIDIKDSGNRGRRAADALIKLTREKGISDRVIIATFNNDITKYLTKKYPDVQRSIGVLEGVLFYFACAFNLRLNKDKLPFKAVQIPANQYRIVRLGTERFVRYCHNLGIAVQYWTIDDPAEIKRLSNIGADCIITNVPDKMYALLYR